MQPRHHIIAGTAWVAGSFLAWVGACHAFGFVLFDILGNDRGMKLSEAIVTAFNWTVVAGVVLVPAIVAVLAIPGTGRRATVNGKMYVISGWGEGRHAHDQGQRAPRRRHQLRSVEDGRRGRTQARDV